MEYSQESNSSQILSDPERGSAAQNPWPVAAAVAAVCVPVACIIGTAVLLKVLRALGLFDSTATAVSATNIGTMVGFMGVMVTASVTFTGYVLKASLDARTLALQQDNERRLALESERNAVLQAEAEGRLQLDTAIRAIALMGADNGGESSASQQAGALFALARLGQIDFALALLFELWERGKVVPGTAVWVLDKAFESKGDGHQDIACQLLMSHASKLVDPKTGLMTIPQVIAGDWQVDFSPENRMIILNVLLQIMLSAAVDKWEVGGPRWATYVLHRALKNDPDDSIKVASAAALRPLCEVSKRSLETLRTPEGTVLISDILKDADAMLSGKDLATAVHPRTRALVERIIIWKDAKEGSQ